MNGFQDQADQSFRVAMIGVAGSRNPFTLPSICHADSLLPYGDQPVIFVFLILVQ